MFWLTQPPRPLGTPSNFRADNAAGGVLVTPPNIFKFRNAWIFILIPQIDIAQYLIMHIYNFTVTFNILCGISVCIMTGYGLEGRGSIYGRRERFFFAAQRPPPTLLSNVYLGLLPQG
jgi:hypothetical protein